MRTPGQPISEPQFLSRVKIVRHFKQQHACPADRAGKSNTGHAHNRRENYGADRPNGSLKKSSDHRGIHFTHTAEKALYAIRQSRP